MKDFLKMLALILAGAVLVGLWGYALPLLLGPPPEPRPIPCQTVDDADRLRYGTVLR